MQLVLAVRFDPEGLNPLTRLRQKGAALVEPLNPAGEPVT